MTLLELNDYFDSFLKMDDFPGDPSLNGIQIQNARPAEKQINKVAFAVDACEETALKAAAEGADVLFVHHGIFWGGCERVTGSHYKRISAFLKNDLALIAYHLPLDAHPQLGNNAGLAARIGLSSVEPFGFWRGMQLGIRGELKEELTLEELAGKTMRPGKNAPVVLGFGKKSIKTVGIISGGAGDDVDQAVKAGLDAYITGEFPHEQYHYAKENGINVIGAGHYESETLGVNLVREKLEKDLGLKTVFIDLPTNL